MIFRILPINPCHAAFHLLGVSVHSVTLDPRHGAFVAVFDLRDNFGLFAKTQIG
ncbi:hypothetical protein SAMN05216308_10548 [Nitrosospira sp. Nsp13]|jgi:hypothetical protein|nr:hypothetical protein SAMN05216308_10548 [Nitrosospira sp. Nsp13]